MHKRGIAIVLIIAIAFVAASAAGFIGYQIFTYSDEEIVNLCIDAVSKDYIIEDRYSCNTPDHTAFSLGLGNNVNGAKVILKNSDGSKEEFEIMEGVSYDNIRTLTSNFGDTIHLNENGQQVIIAEGKYESVEVYPTVVNQACELADTYFFGNCDEETQNVLSLTAPEITIPPTDTNSTTSSRSGGGGGGGGGGGSPSPTPGDLVNPFVDIIYPNGSDVFDSTVINFTVNFSDENLQNNFNLNVSLISGENLIYDDYEFSGENGLVSGSFNLAPRAGLVNHTLMITVLDEAGNSGTDQVNFNTFLLPPAASFTAEPESGVVPLEVNFSSSSFDFDGELIRYDWDYGNDNLCEDCGETVSHIFDDAGIHFVNLTITDDDGLKDSAIAMIDVSPADPVCGDGEKNGNEECDGDDFGGLECNDYENFVSGSLTCTGSCTIIDTSQCSTDPVACISPVDGWSRQEFSAQANTFTITYDDTPAEDSADGSITGLSLGEGDDFGDYAVIVRFQSGSITARNAGSYSSTNSMSYALGTTYHVRLEVNVAAKIYDVYITPEGGSEVQLANDFGFRTGQDNVGYLDNFGVFSGGGGTSAADHSVCNFVMTPAQPVCGNGIVETDEDCDDGDQNSGDGCSALCTVESNYSCSGFPSSTCVEVTQCNDNVDNDGDGYKDNFDFSCQHGGENEDSFFAECQDGIDNSDPEDTLIDSNDHGCYSTQDNDETDALAGTILEPGDGWIGLTSQPSPIGSSGQFGYDAKAIARWDVVPFQDFSGQFGIGVIAFHVNGINRVEFSVDNGPWVAVDEMTLNPRTNVVEYWATLDASTFDGDGPVEVRAIVYPNVGEPRVLGGNPLDSNFNTINKGNNALLLNSNAQGTLPVAQVWVDPINGNDANSGAQASPVKTIRAGASKLRTFLNNGNDVGGGIINLMAGDHEWASGSSSGFSSSTRWMTVRPDPSLSDPSSAKITNRAYDQTMPKLIKVEGVTTIPVSAIGSSSRSNVFRGSGETSGAQIWLDNIVFDGTDRRNGIDATDPGTWTARYLTNSVIRNTNNGVGGDLVRDSLIDTIASDAFTNARLVVNSETKNIYADDTGAHPDVLQIHGDDGLDQNMIMYGVEATESIDAQGIFTGGTGFRHDIAIVNVSIDTSAGFGQTFHVGEGDINHFYVKDSWFSIPGADRWTAEPIPNGVIENSYFIETGAFFVPEDDDAIFPGTLPWQSPLTDVIYRMELGPLSDDSSGGFWETLIGDGNTITGDAINENYTAGSKIGAAIFIFLASVIIALFIINIISFIRKRSRQNLIHRLR